VDGLLVLAALAAILGLFVLLARRIRSRGLTGGVVSVAEEIYRPSAPRTRVEIQAQERRTDTGGASGRPGGGARAQARVARLWQTGDADGGEAEPRAGRRDRPGAAERASPLAARAHRRRT
jgi:hypothetical protein